MGRERAWGVNPPLRVGYELPERPHQKWGRAMSNHNQAAQFTGASHGMGAALTRGVGSWRSAIEDLPAAEHDSSMDLGSSPGAPRERGEPIPLSLVEELVLGSDRDDKPMNIQAELRFTGTLDSPRLGRAIAIALRTHPMTRVRLERRRVGLRAPRWGFEEPTVESVLVTTRCDDEAAMAAARTEFYNGRLDLRSNPPLRCLLAHRPGGDSLLLNVHHAVSDGAGALRLFRSVACAYRGEPDPIPEVDPLAVRDLRVSFGRSGIPRPRANTPNGPPTFVTPEGAPGGPGYGYCHRILPAEQRVALEPRRYGPSATLNDLLLAALHRTIDAWNRARGTSSELIKTFVPSSLRPPEWYNEIVANLSLGGKVVSTPSQRSSADALMAAVLDQTRAIKAGGGLAAMLDAPGWAYRLLPLLLPAACTLLGDRARSSAVLAYFGKLDREVPDFGPGPGEIQEVWGSPPVGMPPGLAAGACVYRGRLFLTLRYRRTLFGEESAHSFCELFLAELVALGGGVDR